MANGLFITTIALDTGQQPSVHGIVFSLVVAVFLVVLCNKLTLWRRRSIRASEPTKIHPSKCCISFDQLMELHRDASRFYQSEYPTKTMRDIVKDFVEPICRESKTSYALNLNPIGLEIGTFVSHSWDEPFADFVESIRQAFSSKEPKPNLWICSFALIQGSADVVGDQVDGPIEDSPFVKALEYASLFLVVRNSRTDLYSRIWCVCEIIYAHKLKLHPDRTFVAGPSTFLDEHSSVSDAHATVAIDKDRILAFLQNEGTLEGIDAIVQRFREHENNFSSTEALKKILRPFSDREFISEQVERLTPGTRGWAMADFDEWLSKEDSMGKRRMLVLMAAPGVGKTGIACKLVKERAHNILAHHFCRHDDPGRSNPKSLILSLIYQLAQTFPEFKAKVESKLDQDGLSRESLMSNDYSVISLFTDFLLYPLRSVNVNQKRYAIIIDALDECEHGGRNNILDCIQRHFMKLPAWLFVYITCRPEVDIKNKLNKFDPVYIEPEKDYNMQDIRVFFQTSLAKITLTRMNENNAARFLAEKSKGLFICAAYLNQMVLDHHREGDDINEQLLDGFPEGIEEYYDTAFERIMPNGSDCLEWRIVKLVATAAEPLHMTLLDAFLHCSAIERREAVRKLSSFFTVDGSWKMHLYHKSLADWLVDPNREYAHDFFVDRNREARYWGQCCFALLKECGFADMKQSTVEYSCDDRVVEYALRHGVAHLCAAGMRDEARSLVLDVSWLMARAKAGDCHRVCWDCEKIGLNDDVVHLLGRAVGLALNATRKDYRQFPGQLIGRLLGSRTRFIDRSREMETMNDFLQILKEYDYDFDRWWCPVSPAWEQATESCLREMTGHNGSVNSVAISNDGTRVVSGSDDSTIRIWDAATGTCENVLDGHRGWVISVAVSNDGTMIVSGSEDRTVRIWDATTGMCELVLEGHNKRVTSVAISKGGTRFVSASDDRTIRVWDASTGTCENVLERNDRLVNSVAVSNDGTRVVSGSSDETIRIWDATTGTCENVLKGHERSVNSVAFSNDGTRVVSGSEDNVIRIWDAATGRCEHVLEGLNSCVNSVAISKDGTRIVSGSEEKAIRIWDATTGTCEHVLEGHNGPVDSVAISNEGTRVVSGSDDRTIRIWDATTKPCEHVLEGHSDHVASVAFSDNRTRIASGSKDKTVRIWDTTTGTCKNVLDGHDGSVDSVAISNDGTRVVSGSDDRTIRIWDATTGMCEHVLEGHNKRVTSVAISNDGTRFVSASDDKTIRIWDATTGTCKNVLEGHHVNVESVSFSNDGTKIVSGSWDNTARIWDSTTGTCEHVLEGHNGVVDSVAFSKDGTRVVSRSDGIFSCDDTVRIWDASTGECLKAVDDLSFMSYNNVGTTTPMSCNLFNTYDPERPVGIECKEAYVFGDKAYSMTSSGGVHFLSVFKLVTKQP